MEGIIILLAGLVALFASFFVYTDLLSKDKIKPHIPPRLMQEKQSQRGNFWDAESQMFYKWDELTKLSKERKENKNDTVS